MADVIIYHCYFYFIVTGYANTSFSMSLFCFLSQSAPFNRINYDPLKDSSTSMYLFYKSRNQPHFSPFWPLTCFRKQSADISVCMRSSHLLLLTGKHESIHAYDRRPGGHSTVYVLWVQAITERVTVTDAAALYIFNNLYPL